MRLWFALFLALFVAQVNAAEDYYWYFEGRSDHYSSYVAGCDAQVERIKNARGDDSSPDGYSKQSEGTVQCLFKSGRDTGMSGGTIYRGGSQCPSQTLYNDATGACDSVSKCKEKAGQSFAWGFKTPAGYVSGGGKSGIGATINYEGCEADPGSFSCNAANDGSDFGYCKGVATFTGKDAVAGATAVGNGSLGSDPTAPNNVECGKGMVWSGTTCVKDPNATPTDPGTGGGDTGTGGDSGSGGDTGTGGGGGSGGGGSTGGGTGGDGTGGTGTGGDGNGGTGTGDGKDDGDKDDGDKDASKVSGEACTASLSCQGDSIQCAILRQQRMQQCQTAEWNDYSKAKDTINSAIAGKEYQLTENKTDVSGGFDTGTRWLSSTCPADKSFSYMGTSYSVSYAPVCQYGSALSALLVAMAGIFFVVYVGRGFGGD